MQNSNIQVNNFMGEERKPAVDVALKKPLILSGSNLETNQSYARARMSSNNRAGPTLLGA